jgi:hypothetical protein
MNPPEEPLTKPPEVTADDEGKWLVVARNGHALYFR